MNIFAGFFLTILVAIGVYFVFQKWRYYHLLWKLPSLKGRFIFGNFLELLKVRDDLDALFKMIEPMESSPLICFWVFHLPYIFLKKHDSAEILLRNSEEIDKSKIYDLVQPWLGKGLLTSSGNRWRSHRKLINPSFHFRILENFIPIFNERSEILVSLLSKHAGKGTFDVYPFITRCTLDIICGQTKSWIVKYNDIVKTTFVYSQKLQWENVIEEKRKECEESLKQKTHDEKLEDKNFNYIYGRKHRKALLDTLLEASYEEENGLTDEMIREETDTFMFAGHDTTAVNIAWVLYYLGWCPSVQEIVHQELDRVFGNSDRSVNCHDINELKYLEAVIKETLRLVPSVPSYGRCINQNINIGGYEIPSGTEVFVSAILIHRDPIIYPNPDVFDPTRFLNSDFQKMHPCAFLPFSAGPRNCIGQKFALMEEKVILANVLRNYKIKAYNDKKSIKAISDLVYRPINGIQISLERKIGN